MKNNKLDKKHNWGLFLNFFNFVSSLDFLSIEDIKLLIWRFYCGKTYLGCAKLLGPNEWGDKRNNRQCVEARMVKIIRKIKAQAKQNANSSLLEYVKYRLN